VLREGVGRCRMRYTAALAHLMHCPPPMARALTLAEFAALLDGVDDLQRGSRG
jgi:hypothetical protein